MSYTPPPNATPPQNEQQLRSGQTAPNGRWPTNLPWNWPFSELGHWSPRVKRVIWAVLLLVAALFVLGFLVPLALYSQP